MNLLEETIGGIEGIGKTPEEIIFIGSGYSGHSCTWEEFKVLANRVYDDGFGSQEVAFDLIIVFSDGSRMWRHEYDGSESWSYFHPFVMPENKKPIKNLFVKGGLESLEEINK